MLIYAIVAAALLGADLHSDEKFSGRFAAAAAAAFYDGQIQTSRAPAAPNGRIISPRPPPALNAVGSN
jgi:hypothetical protein